MSVKLKDIDQVSINYAKALIMDTVRNANSGHTGGPISSLDFTYILFNVFSLFNYGIQHPSLSHRAPSARYVSPLTARLRRASE